ncbi:MAG: MotA/TolQ/ExbB proton channel family protein [Candidatus Omnitrophica bacterium]|nr:MotA/TolQ/ExbB proton channel family protein [Candidatus Omnitrophota bacterium]
MEIATIIGFIAGSAVLAWAILLGGDVASFIDIPSTLIVVGGATAATLINFPLGKFLNAISVAQKAVFFKAPDLLQTIRQILDFATIARKEGVLALEARLEEVRDPFVKRALQMVVDGTPPELTKMILDNDIELVQERHGDGRGVFLALGSYAPAFGMIGTLVGLVQMLKNMTDPSSIGTGMAVALLTTLYGSVLSNFVCLPIAAKLKIHSDEEMLVKRLVIEGIFSVQSGDSPRVVEEKLKVFMPPKARKALERKQE